MNAVLLSRSHIVFICALCAIVAAVALFVYFSGREDETGSDLSTFSSGGVTPYTDMNGNPVDLTEYQGQILVVNSWASWCPFCVEELPHLADIAEEYADKGVSVIAINRAEPKGTAQAYIEYIDNPRRIDFLLDEDDVFYDAIGGYAMPETVIYDRAGNILSHTRGALSPEQMRKRIGDALTVAEEQQ